MKSYIKAIFLLIVLIILVTFGIQNHQLVRLNYYFNLHTIDFPLYILAYGSIIIGIFIGMLVGINSRLHHRKRIKDLEKENRDLRSKAKEEEVEEEEEKEEEKPLIEHTEETIQETE